MLFAALATQVVAQVVAGAGVGAGAAAIWPALPAAGQPAGQAGEEATAVGTSPWRDLVVRELESRDPGRRLSAIVRLGTYGDREALRALSPWLDSEDASARLAAARVLVRAGDLDALVRMSDQAIEERPARRFEALTVLREAASLPPAGRRAAQRALADGDVAMRLLALDVLTIHPAADSAPFVAAAVADGNREVRMAAIHLLGLAPDERGLLALLERIDGPDRAERVAIIEALAGYGDRGSRLTPGPAVSRQLADVNEDVRIAAIDALGRLSFAPAVPELGRIASQRPRERSARRAALALGTIGDARGLDALAVLLVEPEPTDEVRAGLRRAGTPAVGPIAAALPGASTTGAIAAMATLAQIGDRAATPALVSVLKTRPTAAIAAARALERLRDPGAVPALIEALGDPRYAGASGVREAALDALTATADRRAATVVEAASREWHPRLRVAALRLAAATRAGLSRAGLRARLADPEPAVRTAALQAAVSSPGLRPVTPLLLEALARRDQHRDADEANAFAAALETVASEGDLPALMEAFAQAPAIGRYPLVRALASVTRTRILAPPRPIESALIEMVTSGGATARAAAEALSAWQVRATTIGEVLLRLPALEPAVRERLCLMVARARAPEADAALVDLLEHDPDEGVRAAAAWAVRGRRRVPPITAALARARAHGPAGSAGGVTATVAANAAAAALEDGAGEPAASSRSADGSPVAWVRVRLVDASGAPVPGRWLRLRGLNGGGASSLLAISDEGGEAHFPAPPSPGPYRLSAVPAASAALTWAIASGRSPAMTPGEP